MFKRWKEFLPIALIVLFSLFLFRDYFVKGLVPFPANLLVSYYEPWNSYPVPEYPNGPPNKAMGFDNVRIYYPLKTVALDVIGQFGPPLWNPYNFSGNVLLGTYQSALFHPLSVMFLVLPQIDAWSLISVLQPVLSTLSMYAFLSVLGLSRTSRLMGALAYGFSGFFMVWWQEAYMFTYSALFLPLALAAIELFLKQQKRLWLVLLSVCLALSVVSGAFQMTFYVYVFAAVWVLYRVWTHASRWQNAGLFSLSFVTSGLLASAHLIPSLEAYYYSTRVSTDVKYIFDAGLLPLTQLVTLLAPDYFGNPATYNYFGKGFYHERLVYLGVIPLVFILSQLFRKKPQAPHGRFFQIAFFVTLSLVFSLPTTWLVLYFLKLPLLSTMTPSRMMMLVTFAGAVLAAFGTEEYWKGIPKKLLVRLTIILVSVLAIAGLVPILLRYLDDKNTTYVISLRNLVLPAVSLFGTLSILWVTEKHRRFRSYGFALLIFILLGNTFLFAKKYLYFSERRFVYPSVAVFDELKLLTAYDRYWTYENGYIEKNFASQYGVFSPEGYDSIMIRRYAEFLAYANSRGTSVTPDRANALIQSTDHLSDVLADPYRKRTLELLGVKYILRKLVPDRNEQIMPADPESLPRIWEDGTYAIQEYSRALPRVQMFSDVRIIPDGTQLLNALFDETTDIRTQVFLEEQPDIVAQKDATGAAEIISYTPNEVVAQSTSSGAMVLFLSDAHYPGWNVYVDGKELKLYRADYAFRAVALPAGNHRITFRYEPLSWKFGVAGSLVGMVILGALLSHRKNRNT